MYKKIFIVSNKSYFKLNTDLSMDIILDQLNKNKSAFRLFHNKTIWWFQIYFSIVICKILGLAPWKINLDKFNQNNFLVKSHWGSAYTMLLIIGICMSDIYFSPILYELGQDMIKLEAIAQIGTLVVGNICLIGTWLVYSFRQKVLIMASKKIINADTILQNCADYNIEKKYRISKTFVINNFFCLASIIIGGTAYLFIFVFTWVIPTVINGWVLFQYTVILETIEHRLDCMNKTLLKIGNVLGDYEYQFFMLSRYAINREVLSQIVNMKYALKELNSACKYVVDFYGLPTLFCIMYFGTTYTLYTYFKCSSIIEKRWKQSSVEEISDFIWSLVPTYSLLTLCMTVNKILKKAKHIIETIHQVIDICTTEEVNQELVKFSKDILHQKVEFTSCKLLSLNGSLLYTLFGTIITYLVILIQFRLGNHSSS